MRTTATRYATAARRKGSASSQTLVSTDEISPLIVIAIWWTVCVIAVFAGQPGKGLRKGEGVGRIGIPATGYRPRQASTKDAPAKKISTAIPTVRTS